VKTRTVIAVITILVALGVAACGGARHAAPPKPVPKLPRALAQSWAQQADDIAAAVDAGDGCTAHRRAITLRAQIVGAVNAHQVPRRYLEPLVSTANDLAGRITCAPPAPAPVAPPVDKHGKHGKDHKHGKHGDGGD
jgi:hypothetical protein